MLRSFEFSPSHSLFFLWLNEQHDTVMPQLPLPAYQPIPLQLEKSIVPLPTSISEGEEIRQLDSPQALDRNSKQKTRLACQGKPKEEETDRDYHDPCFNPKKQKKNRNVLSNLVHHLLKYLAGQEMVKPKLQKIIDFRGMDLTVEEFYHFLEHFDDKLSSYVTEKNFKAILMGAQGGLAQGGQPPKLAHFARLMRVLSYQFYRQECISSVIHSNKLSYESKKLHFQGLKDILQLIDSLGEPEVPPVPKPKKGK